MEAAGHPLAGGRHAKDYLDNLPPGYQLVDRSQIQVGDLGIMEGQTYGHIVVVTRIKENSIVIAQAWGIPPQGQEAGGVQVSEINPAYFDGFLRPL